MPLSTYLSYGLKPIFVCLNIKVATDKWVFSTF